MVGDRVDAMLGVIDEGRHEGVYRRIEVITGRRQRRNWTDEEKARIPCVKRSARRERLRRCQALGRQSRLAERLAWEPGLTSRRFAKTCAQRAMFVPVTVVGDRTPPESSPLDVAHYTAGRIGSKFLPTTIAFVMASSVGFNSSIAMGRLRCLKPAGIIGRASDAVRAHFHGMQAICKLAVGSRSPAVNNRT